MTLCKNDGPQDKLGKDHDDVLEQHRKQKGLGQWKTTGNGVEIGLSRRNSDPGGGLR